MISTANFITVEDMINHVPPTYETLLQEVDWEDVTFTTFSICDTMLLDYEITDDGRLYKKDEDGGLQLMDDYTGKIEFGTVVLTKEKDLEISLEALFYKGDLKSFDFKELKEMDREKREEAQEKIMDLIKKQEDNSQKWWYKIYLVYAKIVVFILSAIRWVFGAIIKLCWIIQNKIT